MPASARPPVHVWLAAFSSCGASMNRTESFTFVNERTPDGAVFRVFFMKTQKLCKTIDFHVPILLAFSTYISRGFAPHNLSSGAKKAE
jgi:hypothetical protein